MPRSIFITATDTGAGKTWVTEHLIRHLLVQGVDAQALKPIASGLLPSGLNEDVETLLLAQGKTDASQINLHTYQMPVAPALAGKAEGHSYTPESLQGWIKEKEALAEVTLIEGVGGLMAPLIASEIHSWLVGDWLQAMSSAEVMLVVPLRLGCMNHLLLSCAYLASIQRQPKWIVLNDLDGQGQGEETKCLLSPYLLNIFGHVPQIYCVRQPQDLAGIIHESM